MDRGSQGGSGFLDLPKGGLSHLLRDAPRRYLLPAVFLLGVLAGATFRPVREDRAPGGLTAATVPVPGVPPKPAASAAPPPASKSPVQPGKEGAVRFAAYNLRNYLPGSREVHGRVTPQAPKPEPEIAVVVQSILQVRPGILGICEIGNLTEVEDLRRRLRELGLEYPGFEWVDAADEERRLALLSTFPIVDRNSQTQLTYLMNDRDFPVQRGFLDVTIALGNYHLRCVGVHLKSKREVPEGEENLMRRNEAHLLRRYVDGILGADPGANLLVYGDFNETCNEPAIRAVQGSHGSPGYLAAIDVQDDRGETWTHHWSAADTYSRLDYLFCSRGLSPEIDRHRSFIHTRSDWETGSDHRMVVACIVPEERRR